MGFCKVLLTEYARTRLAFLMAVWHGVLALLAASLIGFGVFIKCSIEKHAMVLEGNYGDTLPNMLISVGILLLVVHLISMKFLIYCMSWVRRTRAQMAFLPLWIFMFLIIWVALIAFSMCFNHRGLVEDAFKAGLRRSIKRYKDVHTVKVQIDEIQIKFQCCGSVSYREYFIIPWINTNSFNIKSPLVQR